MTKDRLLAQALRLFARRGIDGVSIADLAEAAGVSKSNVLHHFRSKEALYGAALDRVGEELAERATRAAEAADPPEAIERELTDWADTLPDQVRLIAFGLLRFAEHPGPWRLAESVEALASLLRGDTVDARVESLNGLLGRLTYGVMVGPLLEQTARRPRRARRA